jgi:squalene-associated FAD-dependent desaturase
MSRPHIVVVGGGLAGLSAALGCVEGGARVTLLERRRRLGGLTWSYEHDGAMIDNGQHVFLRCCHAYLDFLRRIGSEDDVEIQDRLDVTVLRPGTGGRGPDRSRLRRRDLPAPLHLATALLGYQLLTWPERLRLGAAALPLRRLDLADPALDTETFASWLGRHGQSPHAIANLWDLITVATINLPASEASLALGAKVFQTGLLTEAGAADIGWSRVPLSQLHGDAAEAALTRRGAELHRDERVVRIDPLDPTVARRDDGSHPGFAVRTEHRSFDADGVIVALPPKEAAAVVPPATFANQARVDELGTSPIVDVHLRYDRPVTDLPVAAGVDTRAQWIFDRTASSGLAASRGARAGQYLAVSISAADAELGVHPDRLVASITAELAGLFPAAATARVVDGFVTKERTATFRAVPGTASLRPGPTTALSGLAMAGAWTDTGWPATMEGAVRSGTAAARAAMVATGRTRLLPEEVA